MRLLRIPEAVLVLVALTLPGSLLITDSESPGAEPTVVERRGTWIHVRLRDGSTTWIPAVNAAFVLPPAAPRTP